MSRLSEDELIARYFAPLAGPGAFGLNDDAAAVAPPPGYDFVVTKDLLISGGHFFSDDPPFDIARKLMRVNLSDLAAKGAKPFGFLLGLVLPPDWTEDWLAAFSAGLAADIQEFGLCLLGGDTAKGPLMLSLTALGTVPSGKMVRRGGVQAGDRIYATGTIGDAALGLKMRLNLLEDQGWIAGLSPEARDFLVGRYLLPQPRNALGAALLQFAHGGMDISDGFVGDLSKMMRVSGVTARIELAKVPLSPAAKAAIAMRRDLFEAALTGGDDYELFCTISPENCAGFEAAARGAGVAVTPVGEAIAGTGPISFLAAGGREVSFAHGSFSHF